MKILIAEDEGMSRHLLENTLRAWGHEVVSASDGAQAWAVLQREDAPHLAILDWVMPGMDGLEVCRKARETVATKSIYIVLLTARGDKNDMLAGLAAGANDYLTKPFDRAELQARVQTGGRMVEMQLAMKTELAERKRAEEVLRTNEQRFRALIENSSDAIALFNTDGVILYASPSTPQVLGFTPEEFICLNALEVIHPDDREFVKERLKVALKQPLVGVGGRARVLHKDGTWRWMEGTFTNLLKEPSVGAVVNNYRDITERKQAEEALHESEEQLRLAQKLEAVGRLAGGIAHDFNNLLTVINGYSDLLLRTLDDDQLRHQTQEIKNAGERAASLTRQLLAFSRKQVLQPKVLALNDVVTNVAKMLQRLIGEDIELVLSLSAALGQVKADPGQLEQVLLNLIVNARDAMPNGGKVVIKTANAELSEDYEPQHPAAQPGAFVMLEVSDCGHGMDVETQKHIFEPFYTTKEVGKGTGLGLSTVYGIVKQSGGNIWVYSEPGHGTTFKIYLPRLNEGRKPTEDDAVQTELPKGSETILLVEDEPMVRKFARATLEMNGYKVIEAADGQEALTISAPYGETIHLLLTDVVMPKMSGRELAEQLASLRPETKVLYMSGYTDEAIVHHGVLDEGIQLLEKPFASGALALKVREVLNQTMLTSGKLQV
jgi:two-component system, cell cycle sensor histidine kinase and response regulator CckA